jgi:hypothetical protein
MARARQQAVLGSVAGWALLALLAACGSGGGGQGAAISGKVVAPGGTLSHTEALARATAVLLPVPNANVFLFEVNRAGNPVGQPIARARSDADGRFELNPPGGRSSADVVVQVTTFDQPQPIGLAGDQVLNSPVTGSTVTVDPASEHSTREMANQIRSTPGHTFGNFTPEEAAGYVGLVETTLRTDGKLLGTTTEDTVSNLEGALSSEDVEEVLRGLDDPGTIALPAGLNGTFHFVEYYSEFDTDIARSSTVGTLVIQGNRVELAVTGSRLAQTSTCGAGSCDRSFTTTATPFQEVRRGTVTSAGNGLLLFTFDPDVPGGDPDTVVGHTTPDGSVLFVPNMTRGRAGMGVGIRAGTSATASTLNGDYGYARLTGELPADTSGANPWPGFAASLEQGQLTFVPALSGFGGGGIVSRIASQVACAGPGCALTSSAVGTSVPVPSTGGYLVNADGTGGLLLGGVTLVPMAVNPSGEVFVLQNFSPTDRSAGFTLGTRRFVGVTRADLEGKTFNFIAPSDQLITSDGSLHGSIRTGVLSFPANLPGQLKITGRNLGFTRVSCPGGNLCGSDSTTINADTFDSAGVYSITDAAHPQGPGLVTMLIAGFADSVIIGTLSADGTVLVMGVGRDTAGPFRMVAFGARQ